MTTGEIIGLCLQLFGTALTGYALAGEWGDRRPKVKPPARPRVGNPWEGGWRTKLPHVWTSDRRQYHERIRGQGRTPWVGQIGSDPEVLALSEWVSGVLKESRTTLQEDWERQERGASELHGATVSLFESLQAAHQATRRRVLIEMGGLLIVAVGTVVSSL